jgi:hypothetical protein
MIARGNFYTDLEFGLKRENNVLEKIKKYFNDTTITKTTDKYCKYDFISSLCKYELKSRKNKYKTYPTTIIPTHKVIEGKLIFLFNFFDGLYYIEYDREIFDRFEKIEMTDYRSGRQGQTANHYSIPIELLTEIKIETI